MRSDLKTLGRFIPTLVLAGCLVRASRYEQAVQQETLARDDALQTRQENHSLHVELASAQAQLQTQEARTAGLAATAHNLQARLDEATALHQLLEKELERLGKNVGEMLEDKGAMQQALQDARTRLAELRALQAAAEARRSAMILLAGQLRVSEETRSIELTTHDGETVLLIPGWLLFEPGRFEMKHSAGRVLEVLARVLASSPGWQYRIVAYTPAPANKGHPRSIFELGALRASHVADRLSALGLAPSLLSVASRIYAMQVPRPVDRADNEGAQIEIGAAATGAGPTSGVSAGPSGSPSTLPKAPQ
jgi:flagellar motor protein MotB